MPAEWWKEGIGGITLRNQKSNRPLGGDIHYHPDGRRRPCRDLRRAACGSLQSLGLDVASGRHARSKCHANCATARDRFPALLPGRISGKNCYRPGRLWIAVQIVDTISAGPEKAESPVPDNLRLHLIYINYNKYSCLIILLL
jgi:hypothetical protein